MIASWLCFDCTDSDGGYVDEKTNHGDSGSSEQNLADDIVVTLLLTEKPGKDLRTKLDAKMRTYGWRESLAKRVLQGLINAIETGAMMSQAMKDAYHKASKIATDLAKEHPVLTAAMITVIAIGVLVLLAPYIVEALGFSELGPIEGNSGSGYVMVYKLTMCRIMGRVVAGWVPERPHGLVLRLVAEARHDMGSQVRFMTD